MAFQAYSAFQLAYQQLGSGAATGPSVVLFPPEPLRFRARWDKAAYALAILTRDMRAPAEGFRPMRDHLVSAVRLAAR